MTERDPRVAKLRPRATRALTPPAGAVRVGEIVRRGPRGQVEVRIDGCDEPIAVRLATPLRGARLDRAIADRRQAVIVFEGAAPNHGILMGLLEVQPAALEGADAMTVIEADVDGERVRVVGRDEIVLECGEASITLRRNGRVVIRGTYVETASAGTNRIKGGQVRIN